MLAPEDCGRRQQQPRAAVVGYAWPAAAVIPAPIAYIKVVAVKTLVVGPRSAPTGRAFALVPVGVCLLLSGRGVWGLDWFCAFYLRADRLL